jgi:hypothetical protein
MSPGNLVRPAELKPLKITCTSADCENDLHCFKKSRRMPEAERGRCRYCGADLVDWTRVQKRDIGDAPFVFESLKYELIRHHFWHKTIDLKTENHARRKGRRGLKEAARKRLEKYIAPASPSRDGRQTPWDGNIIFYAQHALACCCRTCMQYWHGIPKGVELSTEEVNYFVELIMMYIDERMPDLTESGEKIPYIHRASKVGQEYSAE